MKRIVNKISSEFVALEGVKEVHIQLPHWEENLRQPYEGKSLRVFLFPGLHGSVPHA